MLVKFPFPVSERLTEVEFLLKDGIPNFVAIHFIFDNLIRILTS